ncbi:hypothetical protein LTR95_003875 [Oleoguttula sp. CCFEE 5521]
MLCSYCQQIAIHAASVPDEDLERSYDRVHHYGRTDSFPDLPSLAAAAAAGCEMCHLLRTQMLALLPGWIHSTERTLPLNDQNSPCSIEKYAFNYESRHVKERREQDLDGPYRLVFLVACPIIPHGQYLHVTFNVWATEAEPPVTLPVEETPAARYGGLRRRLPSHEPLSCRNIGTIQRLLRQCHNQHSTCCTGLTDFVPTRLLDLDCDLGPDMQLVSTSNLTARVSYVALSYTWGSSGLKLTTTAQSLGDRCSRIDLDSLPASLRDAVLVCRALTIRYLWIDALCIIQDSLADWATESASMHNVYTNAYFTLAATRSRSSDDGFLQERQHELVPFDYRNADSIKSGGTFFVTAEDAVVRSNDHFHYIEYSAWNQRGWTFQERSLSHRVLHFTEIFLNFECRTMEWTEDERPETSLIGRHSWLGPEIDATLVTQRRLLSRWYALLFRYNRRDLTNQHDKFPALSGFAHEMARLSPDTYVAGLWLADLANGLLWYPDVEASRCPSYRAPSWSWAQFDGKIATQGGLGDTPWEFDLVSHDVDLKTTDDMGRLASASLTLSGKRCSRTMVTHEARGIHGSHRFYSDGVFFGEGRLDDWSRPLAGITVHIFLVAYNELVGARKPDSLMLEAVDGHAGSYRRIGTISMYDHGAAKCDDYGDFIAENPDFRHDFWSGVEREVVQLI